MSGEGMKHGHFIFDGTEKEESPLKESNSNLLDVLILAENVPSVLKAARDGGLQAERSEKPPMGKAVRRK
jgi:hypothetical protein